MRVIARKTLRDFYEAHADAKSPLEAWFHETEAASWAGPRDIKQRYPSADVLPGKNRVSEILHRKRPLSLGMIRSLHKELRIPAAVLIGAPAHGETV
jgi:hypothetical protein